MMTANSFAMDIACAVFYEKEGPESSIYYEFKVEPGSNVGIDTKIFFWNKVMTDVSDISELIENTGKLREIKQGQYVFLISGSNEYKDRDMISISVGKVKETFTPLNIEEIITISETRNKPRAPFYDIPTCLLIDQTTQSYGESWTTMYQAINPGGIIGRNTSGANGDINFMTLPTGVKISWSCRKVVDHFGDVYFSNGIEPSIKVDENFPGEIPSFENDNFVQAGVNYIIGM
jgi:hypothetical protein